MKKKWIALGCVVVFLGSAATGLWLQKPALTTALAKNVETTMNSKLNGSLHFSGMDISLSGKVILQQPVVVDTTGRKVLEGKELAVIVNPVKVLGVIEGKSILEAIESITVDTPTLYVWQNPDQTWNVTTLIKPTTSPQQADFKSPVRFHDGTIQTSLPDGTVVAGVDCMGTIDFTNYPALAIEGSGTVDGKAIAINGAYRSNRDYHFTINSDGVNAVYGNAFMPPSIAGTVTKGTVSNIKLYVSQNNKGFTMSGQGDVTDGAATYQGYDISDVNGHASFSTDDVVLKDVSGKVNGQTVEANGIIKTNTITPVFDLVVKAPSVDIGAFQKDLPVPVTGTVGFDGTLWGTAEDIQGKGHVTVSNLTYEDYHLDSLAADVVYAKQNVQVDNLTAQYGGGTIQAAGTYAMNTGDYAAHASVQNLDLSQVPQVPVSILGTVSVDVDVTGNSKTKALTASGHVTGTDLSYNGLTVDQASSDITYDHDILSFQDFQASLGQGTIEGSGTYDMATGTPYISFTANDIPLDILQPYISVPVTGTATLAGHVNGPDFDWDVALAAKNGAVKGMPFDSIDGTIKGTKDTITIPALYWRSGVGNHTISGTANMADRTVDVHVKTDKIRVEQVLPLIGKEDLPFTGWIDNDVTLQGTLDNLSAKGQFHLTSGSYSGYLYKNISADYTLQNGTVYITNGDISSYNASLSVYGSLGQTLDLHLNGKNLDIARMMPWNKTPRQGIFDITAHVGGTMNRPTATGSLRAPNLVINHLAVNDVRGDFNYDGDIVRFTGLHFGQHNGSYDGNFVYNTKNGWMNGRADVTNGDIASMLQVVNAPVRKVTGLVSGTIAVQGVSSNPTASVKGQLTNVSLAGQAVEAAPIDIAYDNGTIHVNQLAFKTGDSLLVAKGNYAFHGPVNLQVAAKQFPSRVLLNILGKDDIAVDTPIDFAAELSGTGDDLAANVSADLTGGTINGVSFTNAYALLNIDDGIIHLNQAYIARAPYKASAFGTIPVEALQGNRPDKSMDITLQLDNAGLDALTFLTPYVESATGPIGGSLKVTGTLADPKVNGSIMTQNGSIKFRDVSYPLDQVNGSIVFNGQSVSLQGSGIMDKKGQKNPGNLTIDGNASWQGWKLNAYELNMEMDHLLVDNPYYRGPLTGYVHVTDNSGIPKIAGLVDVENTMLDIPLAFSDSTAMPEVALDFTVSLGNKVRLYNPALYDLMLQGSVNFQGTANAPRPSGRFEAQRGSIHYLDTKFQLTKAKADFSVRNSFIPTMDVEGQTKVGQYDVQLTLRGPADNMDMILRSNPPLTRQQIVSLITLRNSGKQQSSLDEEDLNKLMGSGIRLTLNSLGITQQLEEALSLDMLTVTNGSLDLNDKNTDLSRNYYNIEMGKYLFNDFMVTAAFGLNHDDNRIGFQYDLGSRFSVNAWRTEDSSYAGGMYRYTF